VAKKELDIITTYYDFLLWVIPEISKIPKSFRFTLGEKMEMKLYEILDGLVEAKYAAEKRALLAGLNVSLEQVRFQLRLCEDLKAVGLQKHETGSKMVNEVGKRLGGWIRSLGGRHAEFSGPDRVCAAMPGLLLPRESEDMIGPQASNPVGGPAEGGANQGGDPLPAAETKAATSCQTMYTRGDPCHAMKKQGTSDILLE
jgi:hypothetical protein